MSRLQPRRLQIIHGIILILLLFRLAGFSATISITTNRLGNTPEILGYNSGHFYPGSNTRDWWRYARVNGARFFIAPSEIEATDDIAGRGDGVINQATFLARKSLLRNDPLNTSYINWPYFTNRYEAHTLTGANTLRVNYALSQLRKIGVEILANITASQNFLTITNDSDWAGKWELWQHFYAQAFYLGREFGVQRYQMYNEPNHSSAGGLTEADYLQRLQLTSDAVQSALADVNRIYGKSLVPRMLAPVSAGSATSPYSGWGDLVVTNRHLNFLGQTDTNFFLIQKYDYHQYNSTPATFGANLSSLRALIAGDMTPETPFPATISEFNVHTAATFDTIPDTLDSPTKYPRFGAIVSQLVNNSANELYAFKFSQTDSSGAIRKNGMHYVDNDNSPYNVGGVTKAGEVWRLFNKAAASGRDRVQLVAGAGTENLDLTAVRDSNFLYLFSANSSNSVNLTINCSSADVAEGAPVFIEEVSESFSGGGRMLTNLSPGRTFTAVQPSNSVWLVSIPRGASQPDFTVVPAIDDAMVKDGANKNSNFGTSSVLWVKNNSTNANARNASFVKFRMPPLYRSDVQLALLCVNATSINGGTAQAHVFSITNQAWSETNVTWGNAPNLLQNVPAGTNILNSSVTGVGDGAELVGQLVADVSSSEKWIDVTEIVKQGGEQLSFLFTRDVRFPGDVQDDDGVTMVSGEGSFGNGPRLKIVRLLDSDNDGLSDLAETNVFATSPSNQDTDGDGIRDGDEIYAGTDPKNAASLLRVALQKNGTNYDLQWSGVTNRIYRLLRAEAIDGPYTAIFSTPTTNALMTYQTGSTNTTTSFYRLAVEKL